MNIRSRMAGVACILMSALSVACGAAAPPATENSAAPMPTPLVESPVHLSPPPSGQLTEAAAPLEAVTLSPEIPATPEPAPTLQPESGASTLGTTVSSPAVAAARERLAERLQIAPTAVRVIAVEEVQWPDGCLGVRTPGVLCTQVIVPGYRVTLEGDGRRYVYHTDQEGRQAILAEPRP